MKQDTDTYWSKYYEQDSDFLYVSSYTLSKVISHIKERTTALDIGCGTGQLTRELFHRGFQVTGIDISSTAINLAESNTTKGIRYLHLDIEEDDVDKLGTFRLITCKLVYAFILDKIKFLKIVRDLLEPSGTFVIITPTKEMSPDKPKIAVDHNETMLELGKTFNKVEFFDDQRWRYYICS